MPKGIYPHKHMLGNNLRLGKEPGNKKYFSAQDIKTRICYSCGQEKPITEYYKSNVRYYQRECKECNRSRKYAWHQTENGKRSSANTKLKLRFGITIDEYEKLVEKAGHKCQICGSILSQNGHRLAVDHDHETGNIRGILCKACNVGIAQLKHNAEFLENAANYIKSWEKSRGLTK